jgi:hypothetical protein
MPVQIIMQNKLSKDDHTKNYAKSSIYQLLEFFCHWKLKVYGTFFLTRNGNPIFHECKAFSFQVF